ncbi:cobalt-precorrin-5B (C(1))-methyltransferase CbiD [Clostridium aminobutyricum]|uniref:Cobalt-precorrin-5B C(1)-methyltransferase n=1 Tax=Clostridium aminobutyricum TaxID=33953 RepID=A0A939D785_CLOAM|nr:cobalt-precorrin-5B (C(1))-methyltransferase CbiD [Clostridium aminobutyricum]MBN7772395.1 cobalamin biosynthesis protein CbiD [Clostridium aminobutyricum]
MQNEKDGRINQGKKTLRKGYTTGTCAAAAAKASASLHFDELLTQVNIQTPNATKLTLDILDCVKTQGKTSCAVKKDSGDDPDITNGILVYAEVELDSSQSQEIEILGGKGIGRVTLSGLACEVGQPAINPTPRKMIQQAVREVLDYYDYEGGAKVTISIPEGEELAKRTYNPRLGIEGGLSVLGTSGIVEPMSERALVDTIKVEMDVRKAAGAEYLVITPGNYGETFLKQQLTDQEIYSVKCSNFIGESLDYAQEKEFKGILFVGHIGKLVKVAGGIMNTHSKYADSRMEVLAAHAALCGGDQVLIKQIMNSITTDQAYELLLEKGQNFLEAVMKSLLDKIDYHLENRIHHTMHIGAIMFSNKYGLLGKTKNADEILNKL